MAGESPSAAATCPLRQRAAPFSLRLTKAEREKLERQAGSIPLAAYIKSCIFSDDAPTYRKRRKPPVADQAALAEVLAVLGASRLASNLNQLAHATNVGSFYFDEDAKAAILRACRDVRAMRQLLMRALGLQHDDAPADESVAQSFARKASPQRIQS